MNRNTESFIYAESSADGDRAAYHCEFPTKKNRRSRRSRHSSQHSVIIETEQFTPTVTYFFDNNRPIFSERRTAYLETVSQITVDQLFPHRSTASAHYRVSFFSDGYPAVDATELITDSLSVALSVINTYISNATPYQISAD